LGVNSEKSKLFTKTKNLKNISKTFQKPIDILIFVCYNIITVRGTPNKKGEIKMKNIEREITINGKYATLYGFDWSRGKAIYRIAYDGGVAEYLEIDIA
jgi:hypothetical protein